MKKIISKSQMRRLQAMAPSLDMHFDDCGMWYDEDCDCGVTMYGMEPDDKLEKWFNYEPPVRRSKSAKPKHGVSGRSVFVLWDKIRGK